jgi:hypothetical protein
LFVWLLWRLRRLSKAGLHQVCEKRSDSADTCRPHAVVPQRGGVERNGLGHSSSNTVCAWAGVLQPRVLESHLADIFLLGIVVLIMGPERIVVVEQTVWIGVFQGGHGCVVVIFVVSVEHVVIAWVVPIFYL